MTDEDLNVSVCQDIMGHYIEKIDGKWVYSRNTSLNTMRNPIPDYINDEDEFNKVVDKMCSIGILVTLGGKRLEFWQTKEDNKKDYLICACKIEFNDHHTKKEYLIGALDAVNILRPY